MSVKKDVSLDIIFEHWNNEDVQHTMRTAVTKASTALPGDPLSRLRTRNSNVGLRKALWSRWTIPASYQYVYSILGMITRASKGKQRTSTSLYWTMWSGPPPSDSMKPKPFSLLYHFTVPVGIVFVNVYQYDRRRWSCEERKRWGSVEGLETDMLIATAATSSMMPLARHVSPSTETLARGFAVICGCHIQILCRRKFLSAGYSATAGLMHIISPLMHSDGDNAHRNWFFRSDPLRCCMH